MGMPPRLETAGAPRDEQVPVHLQIGKASELQECGSDSARRAVKQDPLGRFDAGGAMQHLIRGDVVQNEGDGLGGVQPRWHRNEHALRQADELRVCAVYGHRRNDLARLQPRATVAEAIDLAHQIPPRRVGHRGGFGVDALARHDVGHGNSRREHSDPHLPPLRLGAVFLNHPKGVGPAVVSDDDAHVFHGHRPPLGAPALVGGPSIGVDSRPLAPTSGGRFESASVRGRRIRAPPPRSLNCFLPDQLMNRSSSAG